MNDDPIIYGPAISTYVRTVRLALEEKVVPYRLVDVDVLKGEARSPEHLLRHPFAGVPAFEYDQFVLYETGAIIRYIEREFSGIMLHPFDIRERARMDQVMAIVDAYAYPCLIGDLVTQRLIVPQLGGVPDEDVIAQALPQCETVLTVLDRLLGDNPYFAGDALSLADLAVIPVYDYGARVPDAALPFAKADNLRRWWGQVSTRPSVLKTRAPLSLAKKASAWPSPAATSPRRR